MRNELITFRNSLLAAMLSLVAASCSDEAGTDNRLPEGKYPITFSAAVDGLAVSRATTNNGWDGTEKVAIQIGNDVKKYTAASGGSLTVDEGEPFYWTSQEMQVSAWYSSTYASTRPTTFSVQKDQKNNGYQESDFLYAAPQKITFQSGGSSSVLTFKHLPAKVIVNLKNGDGVREDEVSGATVSFVNQATVSGNIAEDGTVEQQKLETTSVVAITPQYITSADDYQQSVQALLVPQEMEKMNFIKVTIGESTTVRNYYYTPEKNSLEAGKLYTYEITVKKEGLSVTAGQPVLWNEEELPINSPTEATFRVYLPENHGLTAGNITGATQEETSNVYTIDNHGNSFSISYTPTGEDKAKAKGFLITKGLGECTRTVTDNGSTYTFTYSNIRSDLRLSYTLYSEVGYYYYSDGTCSPDYNKDGSATCLGIVFKVGVGEGDDVSNYPPNTFEDDVIHGYVVALNNTAGGRNKEWGDGIKDITLSTNMTLFWGYANTVKIKEQFGANLSTMSWACDQVVNYTPATPVAPAKNSGWYLPSLGEYNALWQVYGTVKEKFTSEVGSGDMNVKDGLYWTSSKEPTNNSIAAYVPFAYCDGTKSFQTVSTGGGLAYVRPVLTF